MSSVCIHESARTPSANRDVLRLKLSFMLHETLSLIEGFHQNETFCHFFFPGKTEWRRDSLALSLQNSEPNIPTVILKFGMLLMNLLVSHASMNEHLVSAFS